MFSNIKSKRDFTFSNMELKLDIIQKELRHARVDNQHILKYLSIITHELDIEKQASEYYQEHLDDQYATSPQTESVQEQKQDLD